MLQFQDSEIYQTALRLNGMMRDLEGDVFQYDNGAAFDTLRERALSMLLELAHAAYEEPEERTGTLGDVRGSAFVCAALLDICRHRSSLAPSRYDEAERLLERIVELIDATSRDDRR